MSWCIHNQNKVHLQKLHKHKPKKKKRAANVNREYLQSGFLKCYVRWRSNSRAVYTNLRAGNIRAVPGTEQMCVLAHAKGFCEWSSLTLLLFLSVR